MVRRVLLVLVGLFSYLVLPGAGAPGVVGNPDTVAVYYSVVPAAVTGSCAIA